MASTNANPQGMQKYRAPSLFQPHRARTAIRDAHEGRIPPLIGYYFGLSSVQYARVVATMGFDMAWIDWEHSSCNVETMTDMVHAVSFMSEGKTIPIVRVPGHDHAAIGFALDAGASIVIPQVNNAEEAKHVVSAAKFGAKYGGTRSAPPFRLFPGLTDMPINPAMSTFENTNHQAAIIIQIESLEAIDNLDDILTQCGDDIDCVWLGSLDCRISMGLANPFGDEPEWLEAVAKYKSILEKHDKPDSGIAIGPPEQALATGSGKAFVVSSSDVLALMTHTEELKNARQLFPALKRVQNVVPHMSNGAVSNGAVSNGAIANEVAVPAA